MAKCERHIWDTEDKEWCWRCDEATQLEREKPETKEDHHNKELKKWNGGPAIKPFFEEDEEEDWYNNIDEY